MDLMLGSRESFRRDQMREQLKSGQIDERIVEAEFPDLKKLFVHCEKFNEYIEVLENWRPGQ